MKAGFTALVLLAFPFLGNAQDHAISLQIKGSFTSSSILLPNPNSSSEFERSRTVPLEDVLGFGFDMKYFFLGENIAVGLNVEYLTASTTYLRAASPVPVEVNDGYKVVPVELSGYFILPVSGPSFGMYMGGGGGLYFGERTYEVAGRTADPVSIQPGAGIHVLIGFTYTVWNELSLVAEMKFRDLQFEAQNKFPESSEIIVSQVHTDGMVLHLGVSFNI